MIRIQVRVPEYGWTTQKVFHFLNFLVNGGLYRLIFYLFFIVSWLRFGLDFIYYYPFVFIHCFAVRLLVFVFRRDVQKLEPEVGLECYLP